ncbi:acyl-CoA N-acyltransferase [Aaosphaeria arxii CBS 175.79]|uniref:Acyl-CoA N-acyltransferase n=1 Tax=Aaosphaeria arxii CBS 175.79 TaxID=1450172 RepID=A0A6A5Y4K7_9PLEO|nr:acyl-CoA N-acyltransferase [Aaosphaeria arxii CBS 175.79]KAF2019811.1 acyl-CoA N-acyltransferase [Aaosphaeria arxii CBS 175.79]
MDPNFHVATSRLNLSYFQPDLDEHCDFFLALRNSPEVVKANEGVSDAFQSRELARNNIISNLEGQAETGFGRYIVSLKPTAGDGNGEFASESPQDRKYIGIVSLKLRKHPSGPTVPDVGFSLSRPYWGKGYATEAASGLLDYFAKEKGVTKVSGICNPDNEQSKAMFRRLGFTDRGIRSLKGLGEGTSDHVVRGQVWTRGVTGDLSEYRL